jgi:hypothetical protein
MVTASVHDRLPELAPVHLSNGARMRRDLPALAGSTKRSAAPIIPPESKGDVDRAAQ